MRGEGRRPGQEDGAKSGTLIPSSGTPVQVRLFRDVPANFGTLGKYHYSVPSLLVMLSLRVNSNGALL